MAESYFIDGVGDEVTVTLGILVAIFVVVVSWLSTRVNDSNFATEDILRTTRQTLNDANRENQQSSSSGQNQGVTSQQQNDANAAQTSDTSVDSSREDLATSSTSESVLRQRNVGSSQTPDSPAPAPSTQTNVTCSQSSTPTVSIRLKFMDETVQTVQANPDETLETFRRQNLPAETRNRYRLIYRGQVLRDRSQTLRQLNLISGTASNPSEIPVIHCFLSPNILPDSGGNLANSASQQMQMVAEELHIGSLLLPILGMCLLFMWYLCIFHTSLFSIQSVVSIVGFSFLYIALVVNQLM